MTEAAEVKERQPLFSRMIRNIIWVAGSRGFNAVVSVAYLAVAARALGPEKFGAFTLILTYAQLIANLVQFQSWKGVIRFGALHLKAERLDRLGRLFGFTAVLDFGSAAIGALIALVGVPLLGPWLHWNATQQTEAAIFASFLLLTTGATPSGILRLLDRFDLAALCEAIGPLARLAGSAIAWKFHPTPAGLLFVWGLAALLQAASQWIAALAVNRSTIQWRPSALRLAVEENERIGRFMLQTNISSSVSMFWMQLGTLAVGAYAGQADAGAFRLARRLSKGVVRPIQPITLAIYPELSHLAAQGERSKIRSIVIKSTLLVSLAGLGIVLVAAFAGRPILGLIAGKQFEFAAPYFLLLSISTAIDLAGFVFEPVQNAHGRSWRVLKSKIIAAGVYSLSLLVLLPTMGGIGAAIAAIICATVIFVQLGLSTAKLLRAPHQVQPAS